MTPTDRNALMLSNSTAIVQLWQWLHAKFEKLFSRRSFVHWFVGEGMEEGEFVEAQEQVMQLCQNYKSLDIEEADVKEEEEEAGEGGKENEG